MPIVTLESNITFTISTTPDLTVALSSCPNLGETLNRYLPGNLRDKPLVKEFSYGAGKILSDFYCAIDNIKYYGDAIKIGDDLLDSLGAQFSLNFPKGVGRAKKRIQIRDAIHAYRTNGTEESLLRIFRLIGWTVTIDHVWTIIPSTLSSPKHPSPSPYPISLTGEFIFGDSSPIGNGSDGTKIGVDGRVYLDLKDDFGTTWTNMSVYGEIYSDGLTGEFAKVPYIRIVISAVDYGNLTTETTDPETGQVYAYTSGEQFNIVQETIRFFFDESRPANVAILNIVTFLKLLEDNFPPILDTITLTDNLFAKTDYGLMFDKGLDQLNVGEVYEISRFDVGVPRDPTPPTVSVNRTYGIGTTGTQGHVQCRGNAQIEILSPPSSVMGFGTGVAIEIQTSVSSRKDIVNGLGVFTTHTTLFSTTTLPTVVPLNGYRAVRLGIVGGSLATTMQISVTSF